MTFEEHCQLHHKGKINSLENKVSLSLSQNTTSYFRVIKVKSPQCKQGFHWRYQWRDGDKRHCLSSVNIDKLKEKVLAKGLEWIEFDEVNHEVN